MITVLTFEQNTKLGYKVRSLRISLRLTQSELADAVGVTLDEVDLFEHDLPVRPDVKRRLLRELWARRALR
ncbi:hypothetical protein ACFLW6_00775 [Chloroflexota bacterium]